MAARYTVIFQLAIEIRTTFKLRTYEADKIKD